MGMGGGKSQPDTSAADSESALLQKEYNQNQQQIEEKRKELDKQEMSYLHSQGGLSFSDDENMYPGGLSEVDPKL